jgi:hypothetical protein
MKKFVLNRASFIRQHELIHDSDIHKQWAMNLILAALVDRSFLASTGNKPSLTNDDVATLVAGRIADATIVRMIEYYKGEYEVSARGVLDLRRRDVGEKVIEAMVLKELNSTSSEQRGAFSSICCELIDYL